MQGWKLGLRISFSLACLSGLVFGQGNVTQRVLPQSGKLYVAAIDGFTAAPGEILDVRGGPPWNSTSLGGTQGGRFLRHFRKVLYCIDEEAGTISRVRESGIQLPALVTGASSYPQDIFVRGSQAYVTRRENPLLLRFDLDTGASTVVANLDLFAGPNQMMQVHTMHADGDRLFIQLGFFGVAGGAAGRLAVFDMASEQLVDVDPVEPGLQAIDLQGAPPHLKMQIRGRTLFVSTTYYRMDNGGGIEMVDLDQLESVGFALQEADIFGADLGAFVMTGDDEGYIVFHTDIVASTHLRHFTIAGGVPPGPDLITLLGEDIDALAYDARLERLYLPTGHAAFGASPGVYALDTRTNRVLQSTPIPTGLNAHDVIVAR